MPFQNRVTPCGTIIATRHRGTLMGNRGGALHNAGKKQGPARWKSKSWISCRLNFKGIQQEVMKPGTYTQLFFLDEAVALAAGHRPCYKCRRERWNAFRRAWGGSPTCDFVDNVLHGERLEGGDKLKGRPQKERRQARHQSEFSDLPDGTFVHCQCAAWVVKGRWMLRYHPSGYDRRVARPTGIAEVLTPKSIVRVLSIEYPIEWHTSALSLCNPPCDAEVASPGAREIPRST